MPVKAPSRPYNGRKPTGWYGKASIGKRALQGNVGHCRAYTTNGVQGRQPLAKSLLRLA